MGPGIILDKSAFESLSVLETYELGRYFTTIVPPVLIIEILADLKASKRKEGRQVNPTDRVMKLAKRLWGACQGHNVNVHFRSLCTADFLGGRIQMHRVPYIAGGRTVTTRDGARGLVFDMQPEIDALIRWTNGRFDDAEELLATQWREACRALDLEGCKRALGKSLVPVDSPSIFRTTLDQILLQPEMHEVALRSMLAETQAIPEVIQWTFDRWRNGDFKTLKAFAPYVEHCVRVNMIFTVALAHGLIGTRNTNRIDMEYLYYSPFAHVFCSNDDLHRALAGVVLESDQSFVDGIDLKVALGEVAEARQKAKEAGGEDVFLIQPPPESLIRRLWIRHTGKWPDPPPGVSKPMSDEERAKLLEKLKPMQEAMERAWRDSPPRPKWPCA